MKKIMVFGLGERGRQLIDEYLQYNGRNQIVAVIDNHVSQSHYRDIPVVSPKHIEHFLYDEIWVCTIYYSEIKKQLMEEHGIPEEKIVLNCVMIYRESCAGYVPDMAGPDPVRHIRKALTDGSF